MLNAVPNFRKVRKTWHRLCGQVIAGRFRNVSHLGSGGMGDVYRADDHNLGTSMALKSPLRQSSAFTSIFAPFPINFSLD